MRMSADYEDQPERYTVVHLTASSFFGGPERQILELCAKLKPHCQTTIASFSEGGDPTNSSAGRASRVSMRSWFPPTRRTCSLQSAT